MSTSETDRTVRASGHCLCGAVAYRVRGPMRAGIACHCEECRRFTGAFWTATAVRESDLEIDGREQLGWYTFSPGARRGFCRHCGSSLFFDPLAADYVAVGLGSMDRPTGLRLAVHIWYPERGDYYEIGDGLPTFADSRHGLTFPR